MVIKENEAYHRPLYVVLLYPKWQQGCQQSNVEEIGLQKRYALPVRKRKGDFYIFPDIMIQAQEKYRE